MKKQLLLVLLCLLGSGLAVTAQTLRPAILYKIDCTRLSVKIQSVGQTSIMYFEKSAPTTRRTISRARVWKIAFTNGTTQIITPIEEGQPVVAAAPAPAPVVAAVAPDQIMLKDKTVLSGTVLRRSTDSLFYQPANAAPMRVLLSQVDWIRYADGREEVIAVAPPIVAPVPSAATYQASPQTVSKPVFMADSYNRLQVSIGPDVSFFPASFNKEHLWISDTTGFGMKQNAGASLRVDFRIIRPIALSFSAGYAGWELVRNFSREGKPAGTETVKLTRIPVMVGVKIYPTKSGLYLLPEAGASLLFTSLTADAGTPDAASESTSKVAINFGAGVGYEVRAGSLLLDLGARYTAMSVKNLSFTINNTTISESVNMFTVRLGIGFGAMKK